MSGQLAALKHTRALAPTIAACLSTLAIGNAETEWCANSLGPEFELVPSDAGEQAIVQRGNAVAVNSSGDTVVGFESKQFDASGDPFFQRFDSDGHPVGSPVLINPTLNGNDSPPTMAMAPDGRFVAVWPSLYLDGDNVGLFARLFDAAGNPQGPEFQVNVITRGAQFEPRVGMDGQGNVVVLWRDLNPPTDEDSQKLRVFAADGTPLSGEVQVAQHTGLAWADMAPDGTILAAWDTMPSNRDIVGRYYNLAGQPLSPAPFVIDDDPTLKHGTPYIHATANGDFIATWQSYNASGGRIHMRRLHPAAPAANARAEVNPFTYTEGYPVKVASMPDGRLAFLWHDVTADKPFDIFARLFDAADQPLGSAFTVNQVDLGFEWFPSLGLAPDGTLFTAWQSQTARGSNDYRVKARRFGCLNQLPVAHAGADLEAACESDGGALVTLDGSASYDPDGDAVTYQWAVAEDGFGDPVVALDDPTSPNPSGAFPLGDTLVTLTVTDAFGAFATDDVLVSVIDHQPPLASCTTDLVVLWPPDHRLETVNIAVAVSDECATPENLSVYCQVSSNEPDDGTGDGAFTGDVDGHDGYLAPVVVTLHYNATTQQYEGGVALRAERDGANVGRVYSILCQVEDPSENPSETSCVVLVPANKRK